MKNLSNNTGKSILHGALGIITCALLLVNNANANTITHSKKQFPIEVKYMGTDNQTPIYLIAFENDTNEEIFLSLKDESGNIIYTELVKDKKYAKQFKLEGGEASNIKLKLTLRSKSNYETFEITSVRREIDEVYVSKIN